MESNQYQMLVVLHKYLGKNSTIKLKYETILWTIDEDKQEHLKSKFCIHKQGYILALSLNLSQTLNNSSFILIQKDLLSFPRFDSHSLDKETTFIKLGSIVEATSLPAKSLMLKQQLTLFKLSANMILNCIMNLKTTTQYL